MANAVPTRLGEDNLSNNTETNFLVGFGGDVISAYKERVVMEGLHMVVPIRGVKSFDFPVVGRASAAYHAAGVELTGSEIAHNKQTVYLDDKLVTSLSLDVLDELKNHWEARQAFGAQMGHALALQFDEKSMRQVIRAARAAAAVTGLEGGTQIIAGAAVETDVDTLEAALQEAAQQLDENFVPDEDRVALLRPAQYWLLTNSNKLISTDYSAGNGHYASGQVLRSAGLRIVKSTQIPSTNVSSATTGERNTYTGDFRNTVAGVFHRDAIGSVRGLDLSIQGENRITHQDYFIVARMAVGSGIRRPEGAVEILKAAVA